MECTGRYCKTTTKIRALGFDVSIQLEPLEGKEKQIKLAYRIEIVTDETVCNYQPMMKFSNLKNISAI